MPTIELTETRCVGSAEMPAAGQGNPMTALEPSQLSRQPQAQRREAVSVPLKDSQPIRQGISKWIDAFLRGDVRSRP